MESGDRTAVGLDLRALWDGGATGPLEDGELLARFLRGGEGAEPAFAALVGRHARLVLRACRSVLGDPHDAQDSAQATFLVLARKAATIRRPEALPSWLHGTARRVATRALRDAVVRRRHERKSAEQGGRPVAADPERTWPELHEEIDRLPDRYRSAIVLCDLSGLTHEQAASRLGCPPRTLQTRLYRGRERLKDRLVRRGVAPAVVAAGLAQAGEALAFAPAWVATTATMATSAGWASTGSGPARLARSYLQETTMTKLGTILAAGLLVGAAAAGAWSAFVGSGDDAPGRLASAAVAGGETPEPGTHPITVTGRALGPDGRPVANARITLASHQPGYRKLAEVATDADGRYAFRKVGLPIAAAEDDPGRGSGTFQVFGVADGLGVAWRPAKSYDPKPTPPNITRQPALFDPPGRYEADQEIELDLRFPPAARISGTITDDRGTPISGARLAIFNCGPLRVPEPFAYESLLDLQNGSVPQTISRRRTDARGQFSFEGLPADCRVRIAVYAEGFASRMLFAATAAGPQSDFQGWKVLTGDLQITLPTTQPVPIEVVGGDAGKPAPGVRVDAGNALGSNAATTDDRGSCVLRLAPGSYDVELLPAAGSPYLLTEAKFEVKPGPPSGPTVLKLKPAAFVEVLATDEETGRGLAGQEIKLEKVAGKPLERYFFRSWEVATRIARVDYPKTDGEGRIRFPIEPGSHRVGLDGPRPPRTGIVEGEGVQVVEARAGETATLRFRFRKAPKVAAPAARATQPITVTGRAIDPDGNPVPNARIVLASTLPTWSSRVAEVTTGPDGRYEFREVALPIEVATTNDGRDHGSFQVFGRADGLGFAWRPSKTFYPKVAPEAVPVPIFRFDPPGAFAAGEKIDLDLNFTRAARLRGSVADEKGRPIAGVRLELYDCVVPEVQNCIGCWSLDILNRAVPDSMRVRTTDAEGRFEFADMPEGCRFRIILRAKGYPDTTVYAATFDGAQPDYDNSPVLTGEIKVALTTAVAVPIRLVLGETGQPAEKAFVQAGGSSGITDKEGRAILHLSPGHHTMQNWPCVGTPYLVSGGDLDVTAEAPPAPILAKLDPAAFVEVTVVEAESGRGIADVDVWREQGPNVDEGTNQVTRKPVVVRSFEAPGLVRRDRPRTDAGGKARFPIEPGPQRLGVARESFPPDREVVEADGQEVVCKPGETASLRFTLRKKR